MSVRAEFTVRPRHLKGYIDTGSPAFGVDGRWSRLYDKGTRNEYMSPYHGSHKCAGEIMGYWSSSPYAANATNAWNVNFNNGNDNANNKSNNNYVRLVRGGEWIS